MAKLVEFRFDGIKYMLNEYIYIYIYIFIMCVCVCVCVYENI